MNEQNERPLSTEPAEPVALPPPPPPHPQPPPDPQSPSARLASALPWLCAVGFIVLAGGIFYVWKNPNVPPEMANALPQLQTANQQIADLSSRLTKLEQKPPQVLPPPDLTKLTNRVDNLEAKIGDPAQLGARVDVISGRIEALSNRLQVGLDQTKQQLDSVTGRVGTLEKNSGSLASVSGRLEKLARIQDAMVLLEAGKPVGPIPNAPPAIAKYATQGPPTIAHLRLTYPQAEKAALAAEQPDLKNAPLVDRMWERAQGLVTVKRGDDVVVGNSSAVALGNAKAALDAGDLSGAVDALSNLAEAPKQAMASWITEAKALISARSALADMAGQA